MNHDSESRRFAVPERDVEIRTVQHKRYVPFFDQLKLGSCSGNAGSGVTATGPFFGSLGGIPTRQPHYAWNEGGAVALYSRATELDPYSGTYPPEDTGSDGLSIAKALKEAGEISGYLWAFTADTARAALMGRPDITGISWYGDMFNPDESGKVTVSGGLEGGHEIVRAGYVVVGSKPSNDDQVWFDNSWGSDWGAVRPGQGSRGSFWMPWGAYAGLLADNGDVTQFVPISEPAPTPSPAPAPGPGADVADAALWSAVRAWSAERHYGGNHTAAAAVKAWASAKGLQ